MTPAGLLEFLKSQPLLSLALAAVFVTVLGGMIRRSLPRFGGFVRGIGNLGLVAALLLTIAQVARLNPGAEITLPGVGMPEQVVEGRETRVQMSRDGHFWIRTRVNGTPVRFMVDTGATLTALSPGVAEQARLERQPMRAPIVLRTANGQAMAELATIGELRFGNIVARDLDAVIAPGLGETNVLGMNFLSRLKGWRVEGRTLVLEPKNPQAASPADPA
ncbi:TIGR02281 family clan AA aspartic protease [Novosphingobium sp. TH158]|uniref:retropepsin-like aspartic protease family protein n=1 Tax=Novosphingobium sp. TH158 TaxID=2067455 RepID=UPI000C7B6522|nr:TIGR02281 family clan AA aspartic protease [Novosphingobium sp. TH158]PLK25568.1 TIGR02281 family clan AA aspartic protease [Novosphingobium sp. TH158]